MTINRITSRDNRKLKSARNVRDAGDSNLIFVEGVRLAEEAIHSHLHIADCFVSASFGNVDRERKLIDRISAAGAEINEISNALFETIADTKHPQGIILICKRPESSTESFQQARTDKQGWLPTVVFLSEVNNPSNLGAIIRTVEAAGASGVVVSNRSADVFSPKALRAAMGSSFRLPIWENADFDKVISWAKSAGLITTAADINATLSYTDIDWKARRLLIFGSEAEGLPEPARKSIEQIVLIPMESEVESLNLAVSCGIILFEARRQNKIK